MQPITAYQTVDGKIFLSEQEALNHENKLDRHKAKQNLRALLKSIVTPNMSEIDFETAIKQHKVEFKNILKKL